MNDDFYFNDLVNKAVLMKLQHKKNAKQYYPNPVKFNEKELKILKKIKSLQLEDNGGFPVIISAKLSNTIGEILMSYAG
jgi:hypothetical protein